MTVFLLQGGAHQSIAQPLIGMAQDGEQAQVDWTARTPISPRYFATMR
jgi:hypothetical protein